MISISTNLLNKFILNKLVSKGLKVGDNCNIQSGIRIDSSHCWHIEIGNDVTISSRCIILAHDASMKKHLGYTKIGNKVFIGAGTIVLPNVNIGENSIVGAGSVVTKSIPSNCVAFGNPARVYCSLDEFLNKHQSAMKNSLQFDEKYTLRQNISNDLKEEMDMKMDDIGYVV